MAYQIAFILEQALGHVTHARNLQQNVPLNPAVAPVWLPVPFETQGLPAKLPLYRSNWTVRSGLRARRLLRMARRAGRLDGLFFHTQVPAALCGDWIKAYPSVVSLDATPLQYDQLGDFYHHQPGPAWLEKIKFDLNRSVFLAARRLVAWTAWTRAGLVKDYGIPAEKIEVIPPGVTPALWARPADYRRDESPAVRILFVGGDLLRKGGDLLLEAFRQLAAAQPAWQLELHLVTKTPVEPGGGVFVYRDFGPNDPRLVALYHRCDLFALPTSGDCLPMVLSEAGAAGLPAVSTTVAGIPEVVANGESGLLIPPGDGRALYTALERLAGDAPLRARLGARAVEIVGGQFDAVKNAARLTELLVETVRGAQSPGAAKGR